MIAWKMLHPKMTEERLGFIPDMLSEHDPRSAAEQLHTAYAHGGGWTPMQRWHHLGKHKIYYPGDTALRPLAEAKLRDETICFYEHSWVAVFQPDGKFEISRMD